MSVYVDPAVWPFGRMMMCHMIADTHAELMDMAKRIGVAAHWLQYPGHVDREHFDICKSKRALAITFGAVEIGMQDYPTKLDARSFAEYFGRQPGQTEHRPKAGRGIRQFDRR